MIRNFICHLLPRKTGQKWRNTVTHILRRWQLFNGRKVIAVALADDCDTLADVQAAFDDKAREIEWLTFPNDSCLREVVSFVPMLERVVSLNPDEATFCFHGKGSTHGHDDSICHCWGDLMWATCCDVPQLVDCALQDKAICGAFRSQDSSVGAPWHFRGTFYWIRHDKTFSRDWRRIRQDYVGTESWPGVQFDWEESACLFLDHPHSLYDEDYWATSVFPAYRFWQAQLRRYGLSTMDYFPPDWFLKRHPNFRYRNGAVGSAMTVPEKRSSPPLPMFRRLVSLFSAR